jgi:hypothetical protein
LGQPQTPWLRTTEIWELNRLWFSAKQNNAFCFFFWKKKNLARTIGLLEVRLMTFFGGGTPPKPPWVGFAEGWDQAISLFGTFILEKEVKALLGFADARTQPLSKNR